MGTRAFVSKHLIMKLKEKIYAGNQYFLPFSTKVFTLMETLIFESQLHCLQVPQILTSLTSLPIDKF